MKEYRKEILTSKDIAYMMDPSVLKLDTTPEDVDHMVEIAKKYGCGTRFCWPCYYPQLSAALKGTGVAFGTSLAFPSGQEATKTKVSLAKAWAQFDPQEHDMVMNVGYLKSGRYDECLADIKAVREVTEGISLKVIIEAMLLTDDEIKKACEIVVASGADYVKSGTGFSVGNPTTLHHVKMMKDAVGDSIKIKVAGGVRSLDTLLKMYKLGACRFGIGCASAEEILADAASRGDIDINTIEIDPAELN